MRFAGSCIVFLLLISLTVTAQKSKVMVFEIRSEIDSRTSRYVSLALAHAKEINADYVILDMNTYGGTVIAAKDIVADILAFKKPIWVFINPNAISAGALISIACDSIYMSGGANIGAATVVMGGTGEAAPDKYQSVMRSTMRSAAEENKRNPVIAEGMVDESIVIKGLKEAGKVITFTTSEAIEHGYCDGRVNSIEEILSRNKIANYDIETFHLSAIERIIAFFLNPFISGILILMIIGGIYFELQAPGAVFPIVLALIALVLYLVPYYLNNLAAYWEIIALLIGILLLIAEIFFIPGFGVAGIAGITLTIGSLILIMVRNDAFNFDLVPLGDLMMAAFAVIGGLSAGAVLLIFGGARLSQSRAFTRLALTDTQAANQGYTVSTLEVGLIGKHGTAYTVLRPSGRVEIDTNIYDAFTRGDYIEKGEKIEVLASEGTTLRVRRALTKSE